MRPSACQRRVGIDVDGLDMMFDGDSNMMLE